MRARIEGRWAFFLALALLLTSFYLLVSVSSFSIGTANGNITYGLVEENHDIFDPYFIFNYSIDGILVPGSVALPSNILANNFNWVRGQSQGISMNPTLFGHNHTFNATVFTPNSTFDTYFLAYPNGTNYTVTNQTSAGTTSIIPSWQWIYDSSMPPLIKKGQEYRIKIGAHFPSADHSVDVIPFLKLGPYQYNLTQLAWFNSTKPNKRAQTVTPNVALTSFPSLVNGSSGFQISTEPSQFVWFSDNYNSGANTNYLYYNSSNIADYQMVNGSENAGLNFEVERGNGTSYNPTSVWDANYQNVNSGVWHFLQKENNGTFFDSANTSGDYFQNRSTTWSLLPGKFGYGLNFTGTDMFGDFASATNLPGNASQNFTISAWVKVGDFATAQEVVGRAASNINQWMGFLFFNTSGGLTFEACYATGTCDSVNSASTINLNQWYQVAVTHAAFTDAVTLYINGTSVGSKTLSYGGATSISNCNFEIGGDQPSGCQNGVNYHYHGMIDELEISNVVRSADYINQSYQMEVGANANTLGSQLVQNDVWDAVRTANSSYARASPINITFIANSSTVFDNATLQTNDTQGNIANTSLVVNGSVNGITFTPALGYEAISYNIKACMANGCNTTDNSTITFDNTTTTIAGIVSSATGTFGYSGSRLDTFNCTITDDNAVNSSAVVFSTNIQNGGSQSNTSANSFASNVYSVNFTAIQTGTYTWSCYGIDNAGNQLQSATNTFTVTSGGAPNSGGGGLFTYFTPNITLPSNTLTIPTITGDITQSYVVMGSLAVLGIAVVAIGLDIDRQRKKSEKGKLKRLSKLMDRLEDL